MSLLVTETTSASTITGTARRKLHGGVLRWSVPASWQEPRRLRGVFVLLFAVFGITWLVTAKIHLGILAAGLFFFALSRHLPGQTIQLDQSGIHRWRGNKYWFIPWKAVTFWQIDSRTLFLASHSLSGPVDYLFAIAVPCPLEAELVARLRNNIFDGEDSSCRGTVESSSARWSDPIAGHSAKSRACEALCTGRLK